MLIMKQNQAKETFEEHEIAELTRASLRVHDIQGNSVAQHEVTTCLGFTLHDARAVLHVHLLLITAI